MGKVERDDLGEVENLSLFEKYPEAFKRLSILFGGLAIIVLALNWFLTREGAADCSADPVPVLHEETCRDDLYCVQEMRSSACVELWVEKKPGGAALGILAIPHEKNLIGHADPAYVVLDNDEARRLTRLQLPSGGKTWALSADIVPQFGNVPAAEPKEDHRYQMPLPDNRGYKVLQAPDRDNPDDPTGMLKQAVTFAVPAGTPVLAMREGFVVALSMEQTAGGPREDARGHDNFIMIQHLDGTIASYRHLFKDSAKVHLGDTVLTGDEIALSGGSGYTTEPSLQVFVSTPLSDNQGLRTLPLVFATTKGDVTPETFGIYRPQH